MSLFLIKMVKNGIKKLGQNWYVEFQNFEQKILKCLKNLIYEADPADFSGIYSFWLELSIAEVL